MKLGIFYIIQVMKLSSLPKTYSSLIKLLPIMVALVALFVRLYPGTRTIDDSFITYRYAQNILAGYGFVFNPGEQVLGTTAPLYTLLMAAIGAVSGGVNAPFPQISLIVNAFADAFACLLLIQIGKRLAAPAAGVAAALAWSVAPHSVTFAIGGLETSVYVFLLLGAVLFHLSAKHRLAAFFCSLAFLTRPDALILIGLIALDRSFGIWQDFKQAGGFNHVLLRSVITETGLAVTIPLIWTVFAIIYFGSPLPHSIAAKTLAYQLPESAAFVRLIQHYTTPFMPHRIFGMGWVSVGLVIYPFLFIIGARRAIHANPRAWIIVAYPWVYLAVFSIANPLIFRWYLTPPLPAWFLGIFLGIHTLLSGKKVAPMEPTPGYPAISPLLGKILLMAVLPIASLLYSWTLHPDHGLNRAAPEMAYTQLELYYKQAADYINPDLAEENRSRILIAAGDVGVLGYYTGARILDTVGLNSPETLKYYPLDPELYVINYAVAPDLILDKQPDYFVTQEVYIRSGLLTMEEFWQVYDLILKIPNDIYGSEGMLIFRKR